MIEECLLVCNIFIFDIYLQTMAPGPLCRTNKSNMAYDILTNIYYMYM